MSGKDGRWFDWIWLVVWCVASTAWCLGAARQLGATFDEGTDIARGMEWWHDGTHRSLLKVGTMPLPMDVATLPLYAWERWHDTRIDLVNDLDRWLPLARAGTLVFWWLLLVYGMLAGRQIAGPWGGRLAVALLACEPNLLAHASLATKDVAVSACLLALVYHFRTGRDQGWLRRVGVPGLWLGTAMLAKASGMVFGPICLLAVEVEWLLRGRVAAAEQAPGGWRARLRAGWAALRPWRRDGLQIGVLGLALALVYCGSDWQPERSFVAWAHRLPEGALASATVWVAEHLCVFSNAGEGLVKQVTHNCRGHGVFLLGRTAPRAFWYYFPVALTMKLTVALLALPLVLLAFRRRSLTNWACAATAALLVFTLACRVQIGIRLILPLVVLGVVGLAGAAARAWREGGWRRRVVGWAACGAVVWGLVSAAAVWPDGLCYTNELWGGTSRGYLCLSDSNYDWGQGLTELARWQQRRGVRDLDVWYFGNDPLLHRLPVQPLPLDALPLRDAGSVAAVVRGHYVAASTTFLHGAFASTEAHEVAGRFLRGCTPVDRTPTFLIYDFTDEAHAAHR
jgi:hypothetical protein